MPFAAVLAGPAQSHALVYDAVVADLRRFADDDAHAVVDEHAPADFSGRVNLYARTPPRMLGYPAGQEEALVPKQKVAQAVVENGVKAGIEKEHFCAGARGRVVFPNRFDVGPDSIEHRLPSFGKFSFKSNKKTAAHAALRRRQVPRFHSCFSLSWRRYRFAAPSG